MVVKLGRSILAAGLFLTLGACATRSKVVKSPAPAPPVINRNELVHLSDVPYFFNNTDRCGPAALASVLKYWGKEVTPEDLQKEVYVPGLGGTLPMDLQPAVRRRELNAHVISGSFEDIKAELREKRPVIVYMDFGTRKRPIGHFLVVIGFDERRKGVYVHSGPANNKFATYRRFNRGWKDTDHWMMIVRPEDPGQQPDPEVKRAVPHFETRVTAEEYFKLGSVYETQKLTEQAAEQYQKSIKVNSRYEPALMALGNIAFEAHDYNNAAKYYRRVLSRNPTHGGANNNLAMVYLANGGSLKAAEKLATKALSTDYRPYAEDTLREIQKLRELEL